jgi:hypothetical protein
MNHEQKCEHCGAPANVVAAFTLRPELPDWEYKPPMCLCDPCMEKEAKVFKAWCERQTKNSAGA